LTGKQTCHLLIDKRKRRSEVTAVRAERRSQAERREEAEARLLQAAIAMVAERGLERVTLADIGEAAGYSRGLPAHYFGSKAGLIVTLAQRLVAGFGQALDRVELHTPGLERLTGIVRFYLDSARKDPVGAKALLVLLADGLNNDLVREPLAELNARSVKAFEANLAAAIEKGEARADIDVRAQAILILATLRGAVSQWQLAPGRTDLARVRDEMVASLKRSLAA
jgi:AcrR family transcriptional regulator